MTERKEDERRSVNPARRKDATAEPRDDPAEEPREAPEPPKGYQDAEPDARDHGGIRD